MHNSHNVAYSVPPHQGSGISHGPILNPYSALHTIHTTSPKPIVTPMRPTARYMTMDQLRDQLAIMLREHYGVEPRIGTRSYQKPYSDHFYSIPYPHGFKVPDFVKFNVDDGKTIW